MAQAHQKCLDCGSSDALLINDDGSTKCFSCGKFTPAKGDTPQVEATPDNFLKGYSKSIPSRCLDERTCKRYKYQTGEYKGKEVHIATYRDLNNRPVFQKVRFVEDKSFMTIGKFEPLLYGMHLYKGNNKKLIITEGEIDCLSVAQVIGDYPVVSIPNGASNAREAIKHNLKFVEQFEEVILCFDMDEAGQKGIQDCVSLLSLGKVKVMNLPLKDPNEMLKEGRGQELYKASWNAAAWRPDGIVTVDDLWDEVNKKVEFGLSYPFPKLTELTYGIRKSEMIVFGAGTGMGKTEFFKEIEHHLIDTHNKKVGIIHLEEQAKDTALGLMSKHTGIKFHTPDAEYTEKQFNEAFNETIRKGNVSIYNGYGTTDYNIIENVIRFMAKAEGCEYIFLDHITAFADGVEDGNNVNQYTRNVVSKLANLTRELDIGLFTISHLRKADGKKPHEEGGRVHLDDMYGAAALKQWVSFAFGLERNQQAEDVAERHTTTLRVLKDRYTGKALGNTVAIKYDSKTGWLRETDESFDFTKDEGDF